MTYEIKVLKANSKAEIARYGLEEFAAEFGHKPIGLPILLVFCDDDLVAYFEVRSFPIFHAGVHTKINPRIWIEAGRYFVGYMREHYPGALMAYDRRSALFEPEAMERIGFELSPFKFFQPKEEA